MPRMRYGAPVPPEPPLFGMVFGLLDALATAIQGLPFIDPPDFWPEWADGDEGSLMRPISEHVLWPGREEVTKDGTVANPAFVHLVLDSLGGRRHQDHALTEESRTTTGSLNVLTYAIVADLDRNRSAPAVLSVVERIQAATGWCHQAATAEPGPLEWPEPRDADEATEILQSELAIHLLDDDS